jgi:enoyl-CoA hydratase
MTPSHEQLVVQRLKEYLRITINRAEKRNALSLELLEKIGATFAEHAGDPTLKCVVLTGAGERCFAAGGDLRELDALRTEAEARHMSQLGRRALDQIRRFPAPVIAALNGHALGGGAELAMACDIRVTTHAASVGFLQAQLNITPAWGGGIDLMAAVGMARAQELISSARRVEPPEALAMGLIQRAATEAEGLEACLHSYVTSLVRRPPQVLRSIKTLVVAERLALHARLAKVEEDEFVGNWLHADHWMASAIALRPGQGGTG